MNKVILAWALGFCSLAALGQNQGAAPASVVNININISRTVQAVNYQTNKSTRIDFTATPLLPFAVGQAKVENKKGIISIDAEFSKMSPATQIGPSLLTYVLWAITPEGRSNNLGELQLNGDKAKLSVTTRLPNFAMIVTAETYFAVSSPSEIVVLQNTPRGDTLGGTTPVVANLLNRGAYGEGLATLSMDPKVPLAVYEARNALRIAKLEGAEKYAPTAWATASQTESQMEDYLARKQKNPILTAARNATQQAEDARSIAVKQIAEEKAAAEKQAEADKLAQQQQQAAADLARQQQQAAEREAQLKAQREAEAKRTAEASALASRESQARAEAEAAKQQADAEAQKSAEAAAASAAAAAQAEEAQRQLRAQLLAQLNAVLQTVDTPRGLVVTMADILFATGKYALSQDANLKLAKLSGVILAHPGLKLRIEGYTDSTGSDQLNMTLSGQRAEAVRTFLISQGLSPDSITSQGMGPANPVASNDTADGRKQNRRVEIIVSGEAIGTKLN